MTDSNLTKQSNALSRPPAVSTMLEACTSASSCALRAVTLSTVSRRVRILSRNLLCSLCSICISADASANSDASVDFIPCKQQSTHLTKHHSLTSYLCGYYSTFLINPCHFCLFLKRVHAISPSSLYHCNVFLVPLSTHCTTLTPHIHHSNHLGEMPSRLVLHQPSFTVM